MTDINKIRAALAAATPGPWHSKGWLATEEEIDEANRTEVEDLITDANGKRIVGASWYDGMHINCTEPDAALIASSPTWLAELCDRVERAETHVASAEAHIDFVTDERERFAAQREEWRAMSIAHEARAESAEAERDAAIAERDARPDITHDDARCLVAWVDDRDSMLSRDVRTAKTADLVLRAHAKASGGEHG